MDIKLPAPVVVTPEKVTSSADMVKEETLSTMPTSFNQVSTVESGINEENDEDDWDTFQSFPASTNLEGSESKTESIAEEEPGFPGSSCIQDDESNETNNSPLAEEADDQHLASAAGTTREDSVDKGKEVEEETVEPCLIEEALTSQKDKTSSDDHLVEMNEESVERKSSEYENIGVDIKLTSTEADSPALDDAPDDLEPQQFQKSLEDDQVKSSNEHVGADVVVSDKTIAETKSEED